MQKLELVSSEVFCVSVCVCDVLSVSVRVFGRRQQFDEREAEKRASRMGRSL